MCKYGVITVKISKVFYDVIPLLKENNKYILLESDPRECLKI